MTVQLARLLDSSSCTNGTSFDSGLSYIRRISAITIFFALFWLAQSVKGLVVSLDIDSLVAASGVIISGHIAKIEFPAEHSPPFKLTRVTLQQIRVFKTSERIAREFVVYTGGHEYGYDTDMPRFSIGEDVIVFCAYDNYNRCCVTGGYQGKFLISNAVVKRRGFEEEQPLSFFVAKLQDAIRDQSHPSESDLAARCNSILRDLTKHSLNRAIQEYYVLKAIYPGDWRLKSLERLLTQAFNGQATGDPADDSHIPQAVCP